MTSHPMPDSEIQPRDADCEALLELRFAARADRLKMVRISLFRAAQMCGFDEIDAGDIVLAIDEACQNVILHGYGGRGDGEIRLGVFRRSGGILVRLLDFAPPVDPATIRPRDLNDLRAGGLGTHFIGQIMDSADYLPVPEGAGNLLEMTKQRKTAS